MDLHMKYLRSIDDSERARAACVRLMQNWMVAFYPERPDIFEKAQTLSRELGGELEAPTLSWKYSWIKALFGWQLARRAELRLQSLKWSMLSSLDRALYRFE
jgi:hypothetical protein